MKMGKAKLIGIATELTGLIVVSVILGKYLDQWSGKPGIFTVVLIISAFITWFVRLIRVLNDPQEPEDKL
ncbi:MAG: AtpZ/AtpI family protein [Bdellovibrionales bacterium]|nr:AtpZ/AtpI family protein [Bdellovibrionales bacterium]